MIRLKNILFSATIFANCLLCFLLIFYGRLYVPSLLQVVGRSHPLFLHFPIVLFALFIIWIWLAPKQQLNSPELFQDISKWLLLSTAFTASLTALMGVFLSKEPSYNEDSLSLHKWSGAFVSLLTFIWYIFYDQINKTKISLAVSSMLSTFIWVIAGHQGASITHGDNFLLAPVAKYGEKKVSLDEAVIYTDMVKPILDAKCMSCHNSKKAKGDLIMETQQLLMKGGKNGALWDTTDANMSLILQRIHLPEEEKKHMPPSGKPQLNEQEMAILYNWIRRGANFKLKAIELELTDTLRTIARNMFKSSDDEQESYEFSAANEKTIQKLNTNYRAVYPIANNSPAIAVDFYGASFFKSDQLKDLIEIKTQLVSLNLDKMPVTDNDLQIIGQLTNLRNLNLSFSKITGSGLASLLALSHLKNISLINTSVKKDDIQKLGSLKNLRHIYIWNSGVSIADAEAIRKKYPALEVETGMRTDTMFLKINPPIIQNEAQVISDTPIQLKLKHYVPGISIRYTLDSTEPDSIHSFVYDNKTFIDTTAIMKARAFKQGWHGSDAVMFQFYKARYKADTVILLKPTDSLFKGKGGKTLNDLVKGNTDFGDGKWIGFRENNMECMLVFKKPVKAQNISVSSLVDVGSQLFKPKNIRIMGGTDAKNLRLLCQLAPTQDTLRKSNYLISYDCKFKPTDLKFVKVIVEPIGKLPPQYITPKNSKDSKAKQALQDLGWFFSDEIFVN